MTTPIDRSFMTVSMARARVQGEVAEYAMALLVSSLATSVLEQRADEQEAANYGASILRQHRTLASYQEVAPDADSITERLERAIIEAREDDLNSEGFRGLIHGIQRALAGSISARVGADRRRWAGGIQAAASQREREVLSATLNIASASAFAQALSRLAETEASKAALAIPDLEAELEATTAEIDRMADLIVDAIRGSGLLRRRRLNSRGALLGDEIVHWAYVQARLESSTDAVASYEEFGSFAQERVAVLGGLRETFIEVRSESDASLLAPPAWRNTDGDRVDEPLLAEDELVSWVTDVLGYRPDAVPSEAVAVVASRLTKSLPTWPVCSLEELRGVLQSCWWPKLDRFRTLTAYDALAWLADHQGRAGEEVGLAILDRLQRRAMVPWLQLIREELPAGDIAAVTILGLPDKQVADRFFPESKLSGVEQVNTSGNPKEILLVRVTAGIHAQALTAWPAYQEAQDPPDDGYGPAIPSILLEEE